MKYLFIVAVASGLLVSGHTFARTAKKTFTYRGWLTEKGDELKNQDFGFDSLRISIQESDARVVTSFRALKAPGRPTQTADSVALTLKSGS